MALVRAVFRLPVETNRASIDARVTEASVCPEAQSTRKKPIPGVAQSPVCAEPDYPTSANSFPVAGKPAYNFTNDDPGAFQVSVV